MGLLIFPDCGEMDDHHLKTTARIGGMTPHSDPLEEA